MVALFSIRPTLGTFAAHGKEESQVCIWNTHDYGLCHHCWTKYVSETPFSVMQSDPKGHENYKYPVMWRPFAAATQTVIRHWYTELHSIHTNNSILNERFKRKM